MPGSKTVPERFNPKRNRWEPIHTKLRPLNSSKNYPEWICKNSCGGIFPEDTEFIKCPKCHVPLVRYLKYEEKR